MTIEWKDEYYKFSSDTIKFKKKQNKKKQTKHIDRITFGIVPNQTKFRKLHFGSYVPSVKLADYCLWFWFSLGAKYFWPAAKVGTVNVYYSLCFFPVITVFFPILPFFFFDWIFASQPRNKFRTATVIW